MLLLLIKEIYRDLTRNKLRTIGAILTIAIAISLLPLVNNMEESTKSSFIAVAKEYAKPDIIIKGTWIPINLSSDIEDIEGVLIAEPRIILEGFTLIENENVFVSIHGSPPKPEINKIRDMLTPWSEFKGPVALIDENVARWSGIEEGDNLTVVTENGTFTFEIISVVDASWSYRPGIPRVITLIVPLDYLGEKLNVGGLVNSYFVKILDDADINVVSKNIEQTLVSLGYGVEVKPAPIPSSPHGDVAAIFSIIMVPSALIALVLIASILMNKVSSEFRLFGIRKALGFTPKDVFVYVLHYSI